MDSVRGVTDGVKYQKDAGEAISLVVVVLQARPVAACVLRPAVPTGQIRLFCPLSAKRNETRLLIRVRACPGRPSHRTDNLGRQTDGRTRADVHAAGTRDGRHSRGPVPLVGSGRHAARSGFCCCAVGRMPCEVLRMCGVTSLSLLKQSRPSQVCSRNRSRSGGD